MALTDEELPVLNEVIRTGDESVIKSTRLNLSDANLSGQASDDIPQFELPARLKMEVLGVHQSNYSDDHKVSDIAGDDLESKIDRIIDKHIVALRKEIRNLLNSSV